ncbi:hypothetical protein HDV01_003366 [Terramyces sp. JEL0728]|nr:hypothetical protein HDV01_003366 [Terramyces sp. JEL0728]
MKKKSKLEHLEIEYEDLICKLKTKEWEMRKLQELVEQTRAQFESKICKQEEHIAYLENHLALGENQRLAKKQKDKDLEFVGDKEEIKHKSKQLEWKHKDRDTDTVPPFIDPKGRLPEHCCQRKESSANTNNPKISITQPTPEAAVSDPTNTNRKRLESMHDAATVFALTPESNGNQNHVQSTAKEKVAPPKERSKASAFQIDPNTDARLLSDHINQFLKDYAANNTKDTAKDTAKDTEPITPIYTTPNTPLLKNIPADNLDYQLIPKAKPQDLHDQTEWDRMTIMEHNFKNENNLGLNLTDQIYFDATPEHLEYQISIFKSQDVVVPSLVALFKCIVKLQISKLRKLLNC